MHATVDSVLLGRPLDVIVGPSEFILVFLFSSQAIYFSNLLWHVSENLHAPDPAIESNVKDYRAAMNLEEDREPIKSPSLIFEKPLQFLNLLRNQFVARIINVLHGIKVRRLFF